MFVTMSLFNVMFMLQAFADVPAAIGRLQGNKADTAALRQLASKDWHALGGALLTAIHLSGGLALLGPVGYCMYSAGMSMGLQSTALAFHIPSGVVDDEFAKHQYFERQAASTSNLAHHDNPLVKYLLMGNDYHIEHHFWDEVPVHNLPKLAPVARSYCEKNGLQYREVSLLEAWKSWADEAWRLAGKHRDIEKEGSDK